LLISGIVLQGSRAGTFSFVDFYRGRIRRILPALIIMLAATGAIGWFVLGSAEYLALGRKERDLVKLDGSLIALKQTGVHQIILVRPAPVWNPSLPKVLLNYFGQATRAFANEVGLRRCYTKQP
jgi:peptidoglycan/LPS O-acetylase OafA/YrhL